MSSLKEELTETVTSPGITTGSVTSSLSMVSRASGPEHEDHVNLSRIIEACKAIDVIEAEVYNS